MITYVEDDKILFPSTSSVLIANYELFNDLAKDEYIEDFKVYYKLIMSPHRPYVRHMLEKINKLDIKDDCSSHGYIYVMMLKVYKLYDLETTRPRNQKLQLYIPT